MAIARLERRLAAILVADVVGYSRLMGRDDAGTLARLQACRRELLEPLVIEHRGRIINFPGDNALVEAVTLDDLRRVSARLFSGELLVSVVGDPEGL